MAIWELETTAREYQILSQLIERNHPHLSEAKILLYASDKTSIKGKSHIVLASASKANPKFKASTNTDFTITIHITPWGDLNESQKRACLDHELSHCGVHYEPLREEVSPRRRSRSNNVERKGKILKDSYGRTQFSTEIKRDTTTGEPKWRLVPHDLEEFRNIVERHGIWDSSIQEFKDALEISANSSSINSNGAQT